MKRFILCLVTLMMGLGLLYADKYTINRNELPQTAQEMLDKYFPKAKIGMIKVDRHLLKKTDYDVRLVNGTKIEFSNSGKWTSVDCKSRSVPSELIPRAIRNYVSKNFESVKIVKIVKKASGYEITLSDDVELQFSLLGKFKGIKMDD